MTYSSPRVNPCSGELCNNASPIFPDPYRNIIPDQPDKIWVADLTYIRAAIGFCYLAVPPQDHMQAAIAEPSMRFGGTAQHLAQLAVTGAPVPTPHRRPNRQTSPSKHITWRH